ncbi:alpha/beta hydrolase [Ideonella sp. BN130291]|uniref:alpha/beta hydrolase n=1 Tax=Ideonella sp. BN130291 TaxID=3112940 RepID=UPI002E268804|nr:alpha/beta hydrolase [Ideonella sp. BN130291]
MALDPDLAYGIDPAQRLDVYRPVDAKGAPLILYLHGGGWRNGDKAMPQMVNHKAPHWTRQGAVFASANYRLLPQADVLAQAKDAARALAFVQSRATAWGADPQRVVLVGHSAGAHLAALVTAAADIAQRQGVRPWLATVVVDTAALDMQAVMSRPHYRFYDPVFGDDPAFWRQASPAHRLSGPPQAPLLLVCAEGREDSLAAANDFAARARAFGGQATVLPVALDHRELNDALGLPGAYTDAVDRFLRSVGVPLPAGVAG